MMRPLSLVVVIMPMFGQAQNLVPNGDFEQYSLCPDYVSQIDRAVGWQRPTEGTSDYFNSCLASPFSMSVPDNQFGDQGGHSGNGYAGFYTLYATEAIDVPTDYEREYVTYQLAQALTVGSTYSVEFFVSLADVSKYAIGELGALLTTSVPYRADELPIALTPQITNNDGGWLDEKDGWDAIGGCFVADSAYTYITIGNFNNGVNTDFIEVPTQFPLTYFSYYFVDDVSVEAVEAPQLGGDVASCEAVLLSVLNPLPGAQYAWNTGEIGASISASDGGTFIVTRTDRACALSDTIIVTRPSALAVDLPTTLSADLCDSLLVLNTGPLPYGANVLWSTGETTGSIQIQEAGTYTLQVEAPGYCSGSLSIEVLDLCHTPPYAPTAFTPNGDGINDVWMPVWIEAAEADLVFTIYDRWGRLVLTGARGSGWDGHVNGHAAPIGIYTYRLSIAGPGLNERIDRYGSFALVR